MSQKLSARALRAYVVDIVQAALRSRPYKVRGAAGRTHPSFTRRISMIAA